MRQDLPVQVRLLAEELAARLVRSLPAEPDPPPGERLARLAVVEVGLEPAAQEPVPVVVGNRHPGPHGSIIPDALSVRQQRPAVPRFATEDGNAAHGRERRARRVRDRQGAPANPVPVSHRDGVLQGILRHRHQDPIEEGEHLCVGVRTAAEQDHPGTLCTLQSEQYRRPLRVRSRPRAPPRARHAGDGPPPLASRACRSGTSPAQLDDLVLRQAGCVAKGLVDIGSLEVRIGAEDLITPLPRRQESEQARHWESQVTDAGLPRANVGTCRDARERHGTAKYATGAGGRGYWAV